MKEYAWDDRFDWDAICDWADSLSDDEAREYIRKYEEEKKKAEKK